jgi:hypothetical protein
MVQNLSVGVVFAVSGYVESRLLSVFWFFLPLPCKKNESCHNVVSVENWCLSCEGSRKMQFVYMLDTQKRI